MKHVRFWCSLLAIWLVCSALAGAERVLVGTTSQGSANAALAAVGGRVNRSYSGINLVVADIPDGQLPALQGKPGVRYAESNAPVRKLASGQITTANVAQIGAPQAWKVSRGRGVRVAVLDTGIDGSSFDLRVAGGYTAQGVTGDYLTDLDGHGTHVAGTIAALDNGVAMIGVAPEAQLYSVKVLGDTGSGSVASLIDGIMWAADHGMQVLNMSLGTTKDSQALREACQYAYDRGLLLVAAAGNSGKRNGNQDNVEYPARYPTVLAVGAVDKYDLRASFSATGPALSIMAPGVDILSMYPGDMNGTGSGTSMAAPHVTGTVALVWALHPGWSNAQVAEQVLATAQPVGNDPKQYGRGRVDAAAAVGARTDPAKPAESLAISITVANPTVPVNSFQPITINVKAPASAGLVAGATVTLSVYTPNGNSFTSSGYTDANGNALFRLRVRKQDGVGAYALRTQASKAGYADGVIRMEGAFTAY